MSTAPRGRLDPQITSLRRHAARGTLVNSSFQIFLALLGLTQRLVAAAFLTRAEFGLWAVILTVLVTLSWLKQLGISDKYIQQDEPDQELAFQKAFTLELVASLGYFAVIVLAVPLYAVGYGHHEIIVPAIVCALMVPITAFEAPAWIRYRRLQYARQRLLTAVNPVVTFVVTVALAIAGASYWCFVIGILAGSVAGALVCGLTSPYRLRLRLTRASAREYATFSWPLMGAAISRLIVVQGALLAANHSVGLVGVGAIGLAAGIAAFADRVDQIVSQTIYPAVCAVADRRPLLAEIFVKSNRVALMWGMPFGVGLALFADDLVHFCFGDRWASAAGLIAATGLLCGLGQVAFNWQIFMRAVNDTKPMFVAAIVDVAVFAVVSAPLILAFGLPGWVAGVAAGTLAQLTVRTIFVGRLLGHFNVVRQLWRAVVPVVPGAALVLAARSLAPSDDSLPRAIAELIVFVVATIVSTLLLERRLIAEAAGYLLPVRRARA